MFHFLFSDRLLLGECLYRELVSNLEADLIGAIGCAIRRLVCSGIFEFGLEPTLMEPLTDSGRH